MQSICVHALPEYLSPLPSEGVGSSDELKKPLCQKSRVVQVSCGNAWRNLHILCLPSALLSSLLLLCFSSNAVLNTEHRLCKKKMASLIWDQTTPFLLRLLSMCPSDATVSAV